MSLIPSSLDVHLGCGEQVAVREHAALRRAGRPRGVHERGQVVGLDCLDAPVDGRRGHILAVAPQLLQRHRCRRRLRGTAQRAPDSGSVPAPVRSWPPGPRPHRRPGAPPSSRERRRTPAASSCDRSARPRRRRTGIRSRPEPNRPRWRRGWPRDPRGRSPSELSPRAMSRTIVPSSGYEISTFRPQSEYCRAVPL